jgi:FeS assembly SUF system regulator
MSQLAHEGNSRSASHISGRTGVPEPTVAKILKVLSKGNLVVSERGANGGYKLVKSADDISIAEIITTMEGPISIVACVDDHEENCNMSGTCPSKGKWDRVNEAIKSALDDVKLKDMMTPPRSTTVRIPLKDIHVNRA